MQMVQVMKTIRSRVAFTLIELLVVISIIVLLLAILFPAIQKVRESANIAGCSNHCRQIGQAIIGYHTDKGTLPPGGVDGAFPKLNVPANVTPSGRAITHGWAVFLLPYLDQQPVFAQYHRDVDFRDPLNATVIRTDLSVFTCPSVHPQFRHDVFSSDGYSNWETSSMDYMVLNGLNTGLATWLGFTLPPNVTSWGHSGAMLVVGVTSPISSIRRNQLVKMSDIEDGASNTLVITESAGRPDLYQLRQQLLAINGNRVPGGGWADRSNEHFLTGSMPNGIKPASGNPAANCAVNCTNNTEPYSFHTTGVNTLFADGSVRFVHTRIDIRVMASLITRNGSESFSTTDLE